MKIFTKNFWIFTLTALAVLVPQNAHAVSAVAQQITGEVLVAKAATPDNWETVTADTALATGDSVKTRTGSCSIVYSDQATFGVEANTMLTLEERPDAMDIKLLLGKIKGKVNHQNATQPFVVTTPAAVATVRGTEVDFGFNDQGELTVDLHNGNIGVVNSTAEMTMDLGGNKTVTIKFDKEANILNIKNSLDSDGPITFSVLGTEYTQNPGEEKTIDISTAEEGTTIPSANVNNNETTEKLNEGREPITAFNA